MKKGEPPRLKMICSLVKIDHVSEVLTAIIIRVMSGGRKNLIKHRSVSTRLYGITSQKSHLHACRRENLKFHHLHFQLLVLWHVSERPQITSSSLRGVNVFSAVRGEYRACRWTEDWSAIRRRSYS
jgi:hypothetical protein